MSCVRGSLSCLITCVALCSVLAISCRRQTVTAQDSTGGDAAVAAKVGHPRIEFEETGFDFGNVVTGKTATHLFVVKNTGDAPLVIQNLTTSCGCTAAVLKDRVIAPGTFGQIEVKFSADAAGPFRKRVAVSSNDPEQLGSTLTISASVTPDLDYEPHYIRLISDDSTYRSVKVRFVGSLAENAHPSVVELRGDARAVKHVVHRILEERIDGKRAPAIELKLRDRSATSGAADVIVNTGLVEPARLGIPFSWGPSVKLQAPGSK